MPEQMDKPVEFPPDTIDAYLDSEVVDLALEGFPGYRMTKDGRIWSDKTYNQRVPNWKKPVNMKNPNFYLLHMPGSKKSISINVDKLVSKYFIVPTMLSMPEHFKRLPEDPSIIVSDSGVIYDAGDGRFRNPSMGGKYLHFPDANRVYHNVHRVVAKLFVPNPDPEHKTCVNHKNNFRRDNRAKNLEWCTPKENTDYARKQGRIKRDGSTAKSEAFMYPKLDGKRVKRYGITAMMVRVWVKDPNEE